MVTLTVFTPTYNRADLLEVLYNSLKRQTSNDFLWMVIDDGSTDNTQEVVESFKKAENKFEIIYIKKKNGGLHSGYNTAIANATTELMIPIDSDDYMPDDGVEKIVNFWKENGGDEYAGIIGLDYDPQGNLIGGELPNVKTLNPVDLTVNIYGIKQGDRKYVVRTDLFKEVAPMTEYPGEKCFNPHYMQLKIGMKKPFLYLPEKLCIVDYQGDGMSTYMYKQYYTSPNSFADTRILYLTFPNTSLKYKARQCIHYVSSCLLAKRKIFDKRVKKHYPLIFCCLPFGLALSIHIKNKNK